MNNYWEDSDQTLFPYYRMIIELNPSHWVGQAVKTIEAIRKTDYLCYLHYLLDNLIKQLNQNKFNFDYNLEHLPLLFPFPLLIRKLQ